MIFASEHRVLPHSVCFRPSTLLLLLAVSSTAGAVVIRDDVDDSEYRTSPCELPALGDMPGEGHGVLIAPRWVVTAAHAVTLQSAVNQVSINGKSRDVERLVIHPGYEKPPHELIMQALSTGDASRVTKILASSDDIALIKLVAPVTDVEPVDIYESSDELGKIVKIMGKGATGTGARGQDPGGPNRTELRRAFNKITSAEGRWLGYVFDEPPHALPLEGMAGNGDSGGPLLIELDGQWQLAGLTSWDLVEGDLAAFRPGAYGQTTYSVRMSRYLEWVDSVMLAEKK